MRSGKFSVFFASAVAAAVMLGAGCATSNSASRSASDQKYFAVKADSTGLYFYGPRQGGGPDKTLPKDSLVTMIRCTFGYCKVRLLTGEEGYIWGDDLEVAPSALIAAANPASQSVKRARLPQPEPAPPLPAPD